jgi:outer membrane protein OmpA-like peptidoglycan-associated protein
VARSLTAALLGTAAWMAAPDAEAQTRTFYLDRAQISGAPDDGFMVWRPYMYKETRFYAHIAGGFTLNPLRNSNLTEGSTYGIEDPVDAQLLLYPSIGTEITRRVGINIMLPIIPYQWMGADPFTEGVGNGGLTGTNTAIMDMRMDARVLAWENDERTTRVGLGGAMFLPTGPNTGFASDRELTGFVYGSAEHQFDSFLLTGMLGPHFRPNRVIGGDAGDLVVGSELRYAIGGFLPLNEKLRVGAEVWGTTGIESIEDTQGEDHNTFFGGNNTTFEWLAQGRYLLDKAERVFVNAGAGTRLSGGYGAADIRVLASIGTFWTLKDFEPEAPHRMVVATPDVPDYDPDRDGDGYPDSVDKCPDVKEDGQPPDKSDGCPAPLDSDKDGIPDSADKCPNDPEDKDGIEDADGCPEQDADNDKVPDVEDKCPLEPGPRSKIAEKNGCPSLTKVTEEGEVALMRPIEFDTGKATIKPVSFEILDEVVTLMDARPDIRMFISGHTDTKGGHDMNVKLSKDRAASVMRYLISKGIAESRLSSEGYGPDKPKADNNTEEGRAKNRRVDFKILEEGETVEP